MNFIDLFSGAGGLSEGFIRAGFTPISHIEMSSHACETLKTRNVFHHLNAEGRIDEYYDYLRGEISKEQLYASVPETVLDNVINEVISEKNIGDIFNRVDNLIGRQDDQNIRLIIGGPPCQAYSELGRARDENGMLNDPRNFLYKLYVRFLVRYQPDYFVFENVPGIKSAKGGETYKNIKKFMRRVGYVVEVKELNAKDFGVLQSRVRVIIIGWRKGTNLGYPEFQNIEQNFIVNDILSDLVALQPGETNNTYSDEPNEYLNDTGIRSDEDVLTHHIARSHNDRDRQIYRYAINKWNEEQVRLKYTDLPEHLCTHKNRKSFLDRFKVVAGDLKYSHTMVAHISKDGHHFIHPDINQCRSLSVREAARIQSFPDNYYFEGPRTANFVQIGNAVPPLMAYRIAIEILEQLEAQ